MFSIEDRERIRAHVLHLAQTDARVMAAAEVGSLALGPGDHWSDLDLTFGVVDDVPLGQVLADWTADLTNTYQAIHLFDLPSGPLIYRVFLLPGCLQVDLSFTPAPQFGATGPKFKLLFGSAITYPNPQPPSAHELFGYAVHHALRARFCIERGRYWQAEYWISGTRDYALALACLRLGLSVHHGRGVDELPAHVLDAFRGTLVTSTAPQELLRALGCVVDGLLQVARDTELTDLHSFAAQVEPQLRQLVA